MTGCPHFPTVTAQGLDPDPLLAELRATEPVVRVQLPFGEPLWMLTDFTGPESCTRISSGCDAPCTQPGETLTIPVVLAPTLCIGLDGPSARLGTRGRRYPLAVESARAAASVKSGAGVTAS